MDISPPIYRKFSKYSDDMLFIIDPQTFKILDANIQAIHLLDTSKNELSQKNIFSLLEEYDHNKAKKIFNGIIKTNKSIKSELRFLKYDGQKIDVYLKCSAIRDDGRIYLFLVAHPPHEISSGDAIWKEKVQYLIEQLERQKYLQERNTMCKAREILYQTAAGVAHNFNNILTCVRGQAQLLQKTTDSKNKGVEQIIKSADRMAKIVRHLLVFSSPSVGFYERINISNLVETILDEFASDFQNENVQVSKKLNDVFPPIIGDPKKIKEAIEEILKNAKYAIEEQKKNESSDYKGKVNIEISVSNQNLVVRFMDNGIGFSDDVKKKVLNPFFTTKDVDQGLGLGLSVTYGIMKDHLGNIRIHSEPNTGTTFSLYFPLCNTEKGRILSRYVEIAKAA